MRQEAGIMALLCPIDIGAVVAREGAADKDKKQILTQRFRETETL
jgi:hypothetical protein